MEMTHSKSHTFTLAGWHLNYYWSQSSPRRASQVVLAVKNLPANARDVRDKGFISGLGRSPGGGNGNPLQYSCWRIPWTEEPGRLQSMGSQRVGHD